ncbi:OmpP1/FadL family transporter [Endozoicomonas ascidiicola]|uniref:OmpP1/FadL family transporter n=1 Tax=Endozoicomonas ascidiicola TaxID=1698521 RepID=UPI000AEFB94B|nr:outer membrane protein transport protein [Endozoicomonas ascidiicola]
MQFHLNRKVVLTAAIAMASQVSYVQAAGYGINEQSASYLGTGFAGRASNAIDASISATNPAGISFLKGEQASVGVDVILEGGSFKGQRTGTFDGSPGPGGGYPAEGTGDTSGSTKDFQQTSFVPFGYYVMPVDEKLSLGLAAYAPYGIHLDYDDGWAGEWLGGKTLVEVVNLQGTVAYKFTDDVSLGFGLIASHVTGELTSNPFGGTPMSTKTKMEGDDTILAWNVGAIWNVTESTTLGASYHSKLDFNLSGDLTKTGAAPGKEKVELSLVMPEKLMFSATHKLDEQWTVMADATWTRWSRFEEFNVINSSTGKSENYVPMNWKDTWALSVGTSYQLDESWLLRAGYMFDQAPVSNDTRTVRAPDANRNWFTLGANLKASENMNIDFAYAYVKLQDGKINESKHTAPGQAQTTPDAWYGSVSGEYKSSSHIFGVQLNYLF